MSDVVMLSTQAILWTSDHAAPQEGQFRPMQPDDKGYRKPRKSGLWTSSFLGFPEISGWAEWCRMEDFGCGELRLWLLEPDPTATVLQVDSYADLVAAYEQFGVADPIGDSDLIEHRLNWAQMAEAGIDAVNLTDEGQWATRLTHPLDLYGWDCESTLWLRWRFSAVKDAGLVEIAGKTYCVDCGEYRDGECSTCAREDTP